MFITSALKIIQYLVAVLSLMAFIFFGFSKMHITFYERHEIYKELRIVETYLDLVGPVRSTRVFAKVNMHDMLWDKAVVDYSNNKIKSVNYLPNQGLVIKNNLYSFYIVFSPHYSGGFIVWQCSITGRSGLFFHYPECDHWIRVMPLKP